MSFCSGKMKRSVLTSERIRVAAFRKRLSESVGNHHQPSTRFHPSWRFQDSESPQSWRPGVGKIENIFRLYVFNTTELHW